MIRYASHTFLLLAGTLVAGCAVLPGRSRPAVSVTSAPLVTVGDLKPYNSVVTSKAITRSGLFRTHRVGDALYFEIPRRELSRDLLMVGRFARTSGTDTYSGDEFSQRVLRWERQGNRVLLRSVSYEITADSTLPIYKAVVQASYPPIIAIFPVETYGPDSAAVIDVTRLYTTNVPEFVSARGSLDERRSFIERVWAFPDNIEVEATQTATPEGSARPDPATAISVLAHWSMVRLPENRMRPRLHDNRVGYFGVSQLDYGTNTPRAVSREFITRFRLERKDTTALLSEPVKPILFHIDFATPREWVPWIKRGVAEWDKAFEAAGFRNAIVAVEAPGVNVDPDWSPEDIRNNVIRWVPATIENAMGPHVHDPRTGEIMNGSIRLYHNMLNLARNWYFTQVGALDPRARRWPFPDSLTGRLVQYVVAHEVGHTLGLRHNMKGSSLYPLDSLRSPTFVRRMGHTPTVMDYARFNYVAQPEDGIALEDLFPRVGPADLYTVMWGYRPIPGARTPLEERPTLDRWARMQDTIPWLRFTTSGSGDADPGEQIEAVGDSDPVRATSLGLKNIRRIVPLLSGIALRPGEDNSALDEIYDKILEQWIIELRHVVAVVGGADSQEKYGDQSGPRFTPLSRARQKEAMRFIEENAFLTPRYLIDDRLLRRIEPEGTVRRIGQAQAVILAELLENDRLARLTEYEALGNRSTSYPLAEMLGDLRRGIWSELDRGPIQIDAFRRNLQRAFIDQAASKINGTARAPAIIIAPSGGPSTRRATTAAGPSLDARAIFRGELEDLDRLLAGALPRASDRTTRLHLLDIRAIIDRILRPR